MSCSRSPVTCSQASTKQSSGHGARLGQRVPQGGQFFNQPHLAIAAPDLDDRKSRCGAEEVIAACRRSKGPLTPGQPRVRRPATPGGLIAPS
jgi:hypothetical protein